MEKIPLVWAAEIRKIVNEGKDDWLSIVKKILDYADKCEAELNEAISEAMAQKEAANTKRAEKTKDI